MYNYETTIYGKSLTYDERTKFVEFKSVDVPDFVLGKDGWIRIVVDGKCDFVILASQMMDHDIVPLDEY